MPPLHLTLILFFFSKLLLFVVQGRPNGFVVHLTHRDSPISLFYNHSASPSVMLMNSAEHSLNRANNFNATMLVDNKFYTSEMNGDTARYHMDIVIGSERSKVKLAAETTSDFTSVRCSTNHIYNPYKSTTYTVVPFRNSPVCTYLARQCHTYEILESDVCRYKLYKYFDGTTTNGYLERDSFYFNDYSDDHRVTNLVERESLVFGCSSAFDDKGLLDSLDGIIGLGRGPMSLLRQMNIDEFSYCLIPPEENTPSKIVFGSQETTDDNIETVSASIVNKDPEDNKYYLHLKWISINGHSTLLHLMGEANIWIDLSTDYTLLPSLLYIQVKALVAVAMNSLAAKIYQKGIIKFELCYGKEEAYQLIKDLAIEFHFNGGTISLPYTNTFVEIEEHYCLAILSYRGTECIFGNKAQQNFKIEYHLSESENRISFTKMDCKTFVAPP